MSYRHVNAVRAIKLRPAAKFVLWIMADRACDTCGLTWVGVKYLIETTCLSERAIREALLELSSAPVGLLVVRAYATGGRGRATEYIVAPALVKLSTAPCGECESRMKRGHWVHPLTKPGQEKGAPGAPFDDSVTQEDVKGCKSDTKTLHRVHPIRKDPDPSARSRAIVEAPAEPVLDFPTPPPAAVDPWRRELARHGLDHHLEDPEDTAH